jgi:hypothetical protein
MPQLQCLAVFGLLDRVLLVGGELPALFWGQDRLQQMFLSVHLHRVRRTLLPLRRELSDLPLQHDRLLLLQKQLSVSQL